MSKYLIILLLSAKLSYLTCQSAHIENDEITYKSQILTEIGQGLDIKFKYIDSTIQQLDARSIVLDKVISSTTDIHVEAEKLKERLQYLEQKHQAIEQSEVALFNANYQCAMVNLISMEREIKPLTLFNTTREFVTAMTTVANPMEYPGYRQWYNKFFEYIEKQKSKEPILAVLSHMLSLSGDVSKNMVFSGPITEPLFSGISSFIQSLGGSKKELREESRKMFLITAALAQWNHEKELIEREWISITTELEKLQKQYEQVLIMNMQMMNLSQENFFKNFCNENDAHKRYHYLTSLTDNCTEFILKEKTNEPKQWKEKIYYQMMDIQALKISFGNITNNMRENILRYNVLVSRYKTDPYIGSRIESLEPMLRKMSETFDKTFEPVEYLSSASRMYRVQ